ncbi:MAG: hypothetical protein U0325_29350 [Polyangiales bacterium]
MSPPRILALHGPARDDLHRSVLRELAEALRDGGAEVRVADALDPAPTPACWRPDATLSMSARDARPAFAPASVVCALQPPFADPTEPDAVGVFTLYGAPSGVQSWHRGPCATAPLWGAPRTLAEISPRGPRPVDVLLVGSWRSPEEHLRALRHAVPGDTFARALDLCARTLALPEPIDVAFARHFALHDLAPDDARGLIRQVLPRLRAWDRAARLDAAFHALAQSDFSVLWVGSTSGARTAHAPHIARVDPLPFAELRGLCRAVKCVFDPCASARDTPLGASAVMSGARVCSLASHPFAPMHQGALGVFADEGRGWSAALAAAVGDDDARETAQGYAAQSLAWDAPARAVRAAVVGIAERPSIAA